MIRKLSYKLSRLFREYSPSLGYFGAIVLCVMAIKSDNLTLTILCLVMAFTLMVYAEVSK